MWVVSHLIKIPLNGDAKEQKCAVFTLPLRKGMSKVFWISPDFDDV